MHIDMLSHLAGVGSGPHPVLERLGLYERCAADTAEGMVLFHPVNQLCRAAWECVEGPLGRDDA